MSKLKITRKSFREWLLASSDLTFERQSSCECPLAIYLGAGCDRDVAVDIDMTTIDNKTFENPPWVKAFIESVDQWDGSITAIRALGYLPETR